MYNTHNTQIHTQTQNAPILLHNPNLSQSTLCFPLGFPPLLLAHVFLSAAASPPTPPLLTFLPPRFHPSTPPLFIKPAHFLLFRSAPSQMNQALMKLTPNPIAVSFFKKKNAQARMWTVLPSVIYSPTSAVG